MSKLSRTNKTPNSFSALLIATFLIFGQSSVSLAQSATPEELPVVEADVLKTSLDSRSIDTVFAAKGDGKGFFAVTGAGKSVLSLSPWGAVLSRLSLLPSGDVTAIFSLTPGKALVFARSPDKFTVVQTRLIGTTEVLEIDRTLDLNEALSGVIPVSVVPVGSNLFLISSIDSSNVRLLDLASKKIVSSADLEIKYARMALNPSNNKVYAFGQDVKNYGSMPYTAAAIIELSASNQLLVKKQGLSNSSMGAVREIRAVFASEKAARMVALADNGIAGYGIAPKAPDFSAPFHFSKIGGTSGAMSADGRYIFAATTGMTFGCSSKSANGIMELDLEDPSFKIRCLSGLRPNTPNAYAYDLYTDTTSGLTFGMFNDLHMGTNGTNFRISIFKNGREPDLTGKATSLVKNARAGCAAAKLITSRTPGDCGVFSAKTTPTPSVK